MAADNTFHRSLFSIDQILSTEKAESAFSKVPNLSNFHDIKSQLCGSYPENKVSQQTSLPAIMRQPSQESFHSQRHLPFASPPLVSPTWNSTQLRDPELIYNKMYLDSLLQGTAYILN